MTVSKQWLTHRSAKRTIVSSWPCFSEVPCVASEALAKSIIRLILASWAIIALEGLRHSVIHESTLFLLLGEPSKSCALSIFQPNVRRVAETPRPFLSQDRQTTELINFLLVGLIVLSGCPCCLWVFISGNIFAFLFLVVTFLFSYTSHAHWFTQDRVSLGEVLLGRRDLHTFYCSPGLDWDNISVILATWGVIKRGGPPVFLI